MRSHAGGYLVFEPQLKLSLQCQARKRLKKERASVLTGDRVELSDVDQEQGTAVITFIHDRQSLLSRPPLANVDQVVIVQAVRQPEWNQLWCDRYIVHFQLELPDSMPILCFNKCDLVDEKQAKTLRGIYEPLGYSVVLVSAKTGQGLDQLLDLLSGKITVFAGPSGVGKSSILNKLEPSLNLKIGVMNHDFGVGRHTTTYSKLYQITTCHSSNLTRSARSTTSSLTWVADTPGFNLCELRHPGPLDVMWQFPEIARLSNDCKYSNCLHLVEDGCKVIESIVEGEPRPDIDSAPAKDAEVRKNGDMSQSDQAPLPVSRARYENYAVVVAEAQDEYNYRRTVSTKVESGVKRVGGDKVIPRLKNSYRAVSRRKEKQKLGHAVVFDDELDLGEESDEEESSQDSDLKN